MSDASASRSNNRSVDSWFETPSLSDRIDASPSSIKRSLFPWQSITSKPLDGPVPRRPPPPPRSGGAPRPKQRRSNLSNADHPDDVSECTIDTSIRDQQRNQYSLSSSLPPPIHVHRVIAELKLEVANLKSDSDRVCLVRKQLERACQEKDDLIEQLSVENQQLMLQCKQMEKKFLLMSMGHTQGVQRPSVLRPSGDTADTATSTTYQFGNNVDELSEREGVSIEFNNEVMKSIRFNTQENEDEDSNEVIDEALEDVNVNDTHGRSRASNPQAVNSQNQQIEVYPVDDPFSTLNEYDEEDEKPLKWFGWGRSIL